MTTLPERLLAAASGMDTAGNTITARLLREAATALQPSAGGVVETMINHTRDPHCIGCYVIRWNDGAPVAECNECRATVALLDGLASPAQADGWRPIDEAPRDGTAIMLGNAAGAWVAYYHPVYQSGYRPANQWASLMLNHEHMGKADRFSPPTHWKPLTAAPSAPRAGDTAQDSGQV